MKTPLENLPAVSFATHSAAEIEREILTTFERIQGVTLYPGTPERLFLEALAYWVSLQNGLIDQAGKQNLLAYATGAHLDHLGALMGTVRLTPTAATCTLRFTMQASHNFNVLIPAGTRVGTGDRAIYFATSTPAEIPAGLLSVDVAATATTPGAAGNGLVAGQINLLVDPIAYIMRATNTTITLGGADMETDERYRERIQLAPEAYTCAGSEGSYRYHALKVHPDIAEVTVWSPTPGTVDIRPVLCGGELPDEGLIANIRKALSADTVRPLTDTVIVAAPEPVNYDIRGAWYMRRSDAALSASIQKAVLNAVEQYRLWQRSAPGRDINPTRLVAMVERAGAKRVTLAFPNFLPLKGFQIARESAVVFDFLGFEDD